MMASTLDGLRLDRQRELGDLGLGGFQFPGPLGRRGRPSCASGIDASEWKADGGEHAPDRWLGAL
jgi:hypothetical protein